MTQNILVKKRNGRGTEPLDLNKIHEMVEEACSDISGVSASQVEIQSQLSFYNGITTADIQETPREVKTKGATHGWRAREHQRRWKRGRGARRWKAG